MTQERKGIKRNGAGSYTLESKKKDNPSKTTVKKKSESLDKKKEG